MESPESLRGARIYLAGHRGMVGSAIHRQLIALGLEEGLLLRTSEELDLRRQAEVEDFMSSQRPDIVIFAAARVGGIQANQTYLAEFLFENGAMALNTIRAAYENEVRRFLFLGSTCIYPRSAPQPIQEDALLTSPLEPTNEGYALAKIVGLKLCQYLRQQYGVLYHSAMPTNLYGPGDNYHPEHAHVLPALLRRFHEAREENAPQVTIWGTGKPLREFLHVDDLARAVLHLLALESPPDLVNVGSGQEISIRELAQLIAEVVGYRGQIVHDTGKPDGTPRKLCDTSRIRATGWRPQIGLRQGIVQTYAAFQQEIANDMVRAK